MANVIFKPRTLVGATPQPIYLIYRFGRNDKLAFPTGLKINPQHWNKRTARARDLVECITKDIINNRLNELEAITERHITKLKSQSEAITKEGLRDFLNNYINPPKNNTNTLRGFLIDFIEKSPNRTNKKTGTIIGKKTQLGYKRTLSYITRFEAHTKQTYDFKDLGLDFYNNFTKFLQSNKLATNTIGREIKTLKIILNEAKSRGKELNREFLNGCFVVMTEESENVYLNENELALLYNFDFSNNKRLERVRDLFLVGAWTGLRFSDFTRITKEHIKGNFIEIEQQKTGKRVLIPLHPVVSDIWKRYGEALPPNITNQKLNDYIKEVCQIVGLTDYEHKAITRGGVRTSTRYEKWELVSSHTARRSFATNLFLSGFPTLSIMQVTGHRTEKAFMRYIKVTPEQHAVLLQAHWAQNGNYLRVANR
ncbi:MAG: site-specific integrase [Candidatus Azobacteroides sp.]|nr:site-specific integrase [Candidatus Azobacteroides sp.]